MILGELNQISGSLYVLMNRFLEILKVAPH